MDTGGQKVAQCFAGILGIRTEHSLKDNVVHDAERFTLSGIFLSQFFQFS
jgi:hypothetical protein